MRAFHSEASRCCAFLDITRLSVRGKQYKIEGQAFGIPKCFNGYPRYGILKDTAGCIVFFFFFFSFVDEPPVSRRVRRRSMPCLPKAL